MADEIATPEQIAEYESQLANINSLLEASPDDDSLLALKSDMEASLATSVEPALAETSIVEMGKTTTTTTLPSLEDLPPPPASESVSLSTMTNNNNYDMGLVDVHAGLLAAAAALPDVNSDDDDDDHNDSINNDNNNLISKSMMMTMAAATTNSSSMKKKEKIKEFVLPPHLVPNEADTEAERNKKRRAAKALKNKWRQKKKEVESNNKQTS
jgi:hypothetical protein